MKKFYQYFKIAGITLFLILFTGYSQNLVQDELLLDMDGDKDVTVEGDSMVTSWKNQVPGAAAVDFNYTDRGRTYDYVNTAYRQTEPGTGRPQYSRNVTEINGHNSLIFRSDELINDNDDAFDGLITGKGYTWFTVLKPYSQEGGGGLYPHAFFGCLRNSQEVQLEGGQFAGFWGSFYLDGTVWMSSRNGTGGFSRAGVTTPEVTGGIPSIDEWHIIAGRQAAGTGNVLLEVFVDSVSAPVNTEQYPVATVEPSRMAIGTERNAVNHQGGESFDGEMARLLIYGKPLSQQEMNDVFNYLRSMYLEPPTSVQNSFKISPNTLNSKLYDVKGVVIPVKEKSEKIYLK